MAITKDNIGSVLGPARRSAQSLVEESENPVIVTLGGEILRLLSKAEAQEPY